MEEINTRALVCAEVLRHEEEFIKATYIVNAINVSKQLVYYHLTKLVSEGILEKAGTRYLLVNRDKLIDTMVNSTDNRGGLQRSSICTFLPKDYIDSIQIVVDDTVLGRAMDLPESMDVKTFVAEEIQKAIENLKKERNYLLNKQVTRGSARKQIRKFGNDWYSSAAKRFENMGFEFQTSSKSREDDLTDKLEEED